MIKDTASQKWIVFAFNRTSNAPVTGDAANITANLRLDGGAANPVDDTNPTELSDGYYYFDLTAAETNADMIVIIPVSATADVLVIGVPGAVWTESDFTATQKTSLNAATPASVQNIPVDGSLQVDVVALSGDSTAADNLESMYDGTGYVDDTAPASRGQISGIQASGGAFIASTIVDNNITGTDPLNGVTKVAGATTGNVTDLTAQDGTGLEVPNDSNEIDIVFQINIPANAVPLAVLFDGHVNGSNDNCPIKAYDHDNTTWVTIATIDGQAGSANNEIVAPLGESRYASSTGVVYIRFDSSGSSQSLFLDRLAVEYANQTIGYADGAIWVNTNASNTNTTKFIDGTADNPVSTWAAALTLSTALGIKNFRLIAGSSITLTGNSDSFVIIGYASSVALGGQSISGAYFEGVAVSGNDDGSNTIPARFKNCTIGTCTLGLFRMNQCPFTGTVTLAEAGTYITEQCLCSCTGGNAPIFDMGAAIGGTTLNFRHYAGNLSLQNLGANGTDTVAVQGMGRVALDATCVGGTLALQGNIILANSGSGVTVSDDARFDVDQIRDSLVDDAIRIDASALNTLSGHDPGENIMGASDLATEMGRIDVAVSTRSSHAAADIWAVGTRTLTSFGTLVADIATAVWAAVTRTLTAIPTGGATETKQDTIIGHVDGLNGDAMRGTDGANTVVPDAAGTAATLLADMALDSTVAKEATVNALNNISPAEVNAEVDTALSDYGGSKPGVAQTITPPADMALNSTVAKEATVAALNNISVADIIAGINEGDLDLEEILRLILAAVAGNASGGGTSNLVFKNPAGTKTRITATVDEDGNRTVVVDGDDA